MNKHSIYNKPSLLFGHGEKNSRQKISNLKKKLNFSAYSRKFVENEKILNKYVRLLPMN